MSQSENESGRLPSINHDALAVVTCSFEFIYAKQTETFAIRSPLVLISAVRIIVA